MMTKISSQLRRITSPTAMALLVAVILSLANFYSLRFWGSPDLLASAGVDRRLTLYQMVAGSSSLMLAVVSPGLYLYSHSNHPRVVELRRSLGTRGLEIWAGAITALVVLTLVCMLALVVEPASQAPDAYLPRLMVQGAALWALFCVVRALLSYFLALRSSLDWVSVRQVREAERSDLQPPRR